MGGVSNSIGSTLSNFGSSVVNVAGQVPVVGGFLGSSTATLLGQPQSSGSTGLNAGALVPNVQLANSDQANNSINTLNNIANTYGTQSQQYQQAAQQYEQAYNQAISQTQGQISNTNSAINAAQNQQSLANQAYGQAQATNQQVGGSALNLLQQAALGNSPSAAQAQLQAGLDQTIASQRALANSGAVSGMVSNQKEALDNAAQLAQSSSNQAAQLRAQQQVAAQGQYGTEATNVAAQAGANANIATGNTAQAANIAGQANTLANTQANIANLQQTAYAQNLTAGQNYANLQNTATQNAGQLATSLNATQQQAYNAHQAAEGQAIGGLESAAGSAAASGLLGSAAGGAAAGSGASASNAELNAIPIAGDTTVGGASAAGSGTAGFAALGAYKGGIVPNHYAKGGFVTDKCSSGLEDNYHNTTIPNYLDGGKIPGKGTVPGNNIKNDTIPIIVSPGEIVIPRSHAYSLESAVEFLQELMEKKQKNQKNAEIRTFLDLAHKHNPKLIENGEEITDPKEKSEKVKAVKGIVKEVSDIEELMKHLAKKKK